LFLNVYVYVTTFSAGSSFAKTVSGSVNGVSCVSDRASRSASAINFNEADEVLSSVSPSG